MQTAFQSSNKPSEKSSIKHKKKSTNLKNNSLPIQVVSAALVADSNNFNPLNIIQQKSFSMKNDHCHEGQKCSNSSCSTSKKSSQPQQTKDDQFHKDKISTDKLDNQFSVISEKQKQQNKYGNPNIQTNKKMKEEAKAEQIKMSSYGKRIFIGNGSQSIGQQGKQQIVAFLGLFIPIIIFLLYEIQYSSGLLSYSSGESWLICTIISSFFCFILFIYSSQSNPGFIAVPLSQKQRHALPVVQSKGKKEFDLRYCHTCHIYRPLRTHHCKICDLCVIERDHHCPFLNNCIGYNNRRGYVYFLLFTVLTELLIISETLFQIIYPFVEDDDFVKTIQRISVIIAIIQCIYAAILAANVLSLFIFQLQLIARNRTTDEFRRLIVPQPKPIDIELNQEFDQGCLHNFNNALFCRDPPEQIYSNFAQLSKEYLIQRYTYFQKKNQKFIKKEVAEEEDDKLNKSNHTHNPNHTQYPLQIDNNHNNQYITSIQSKPSFSPIKIAFPQSLQSNFFPPTQKEYGNISVSNQNQPLNCVFNQSNNLNRILDQEQSPPLIGIDGGNKNINFNQINDITLGIKNDKTAEISYSQGRNNNHSNQSATTTNNHFNQQYHQNSPSSSTQTKKNNQQLQELQQFNLAEDQPKLTQQRSQHNQQTAQMAVASRLNNNIQSDTTSLSKQDTSHRGVDNLSSVNKYQGTFSLQGLDIPTSGRLLNNNEKRRQSIDSAEQNRTYFHSQQIQNNKFKNQDTCDFDQKIIFYDLKDLKQSESDSSSQVPKRNTLSASMISKSQYYSTKISDSHQNSNTNNAILSRNSLVSGTSTNNRRGGDLKKISFNQYSRQDVQSINLNNIQSDDDLDDVRNNSYIEQKPNDFGGLKTLQHNNSASSRRHKGIKKRQSVTYTPHYLQNLDNYPQNLDNSPQNLDNSPQNLANFPQHVDNSPQNVDNSPQHIDNSPQNINNSPQNVDGSPSFQNGNHMAQQKNSPQFQSNGYYQQKQHKLQQLQYKNNNSSQESSTTQAHQQEKENEGRDFSRMSTITMAKNTNMANHDNLTADEPYKNTKIIYFDPSQEQSTDLPTTINDNHNQQKFGNEKFLSVLQPNSSNETDDFNIDNYQNQQQQQSQKQVVSKRARRLFQNFQKPSSQQTAVGNNQNNSSFMSNELYSNDNFKQVQHNSSLNFEQRKQNPINKESLNSQISTQPHSKNFKLSPTFINKKYL